MVFFDGITAGEKDFSTLVARLKKENIDFVYYGGYHPEMGQILRQARAAGLKTQFMGPEGVANVSLSNIAGESAEGLLVTKPKNYDRCLRTNLLSMPSRRRNRIQAVRSSGPLTQRCNLCKRA